MMFIVILLALLVERFFDCSPFRQWGWYHDLQAQLAKRFSNQSSCWIILSSVLVVLFLTMILDWTIARSFYGLLKLFFQLIVVLYCMGPQNFWVTALACMNAHTSSQPISAEKVLKNKLNVIPSSTPSEQSALYRQLLQQLFIHAYQHVVPVLFWYALFSLPGAVLYKIISLSSTPSAPDAEQLGVIFIEGQRLKTIKAILDWLPVRLFTLMFALSGHFVPVFRHWRNALCEPTTPQEKLLSDCGLAALDLNQKDIIEPDDGALAKEAIALIDRVFIIALSLLGIIMVFITL